MQSVIDVKEDASVKPVTIIFLLIAFQLIARLYHIILFLSM